MLQLIGAVAGIDQFSSRRKKSRLSSYTIEQPELDVRVNKLNGENQNDAINPIPGSTVSATLLFGVKTSDL